MLDFLNSIPDGRIVLAAATGYNTPHSFVQDAFANLFGSKYAFLVHGWNAWALITRKGAATPLAEGVQAASGRYGSEAAAETRYPLAKPSADTLPPVAAFLVNRGETETTDNRVILDLASVWDYNSGVSPGGKAQFSNDGRSWTAAEDFGPSSVWHLERGNGSKLVHARFRDRDGNWSGSVSHRYRTIANCSARALHLSSNGCRGRAGTCQLSPRRKDRALVLPCLYRCARRRQARLSSGRERDSA